MCLSFNFTTRDHYETVLNIILYDVNHVSMFAIECTTLVPVYRF